MTRLFFILFFIIQTPIWGNASFTAIHEVNNVRLDINNYTGGITDNTYPALLSLIQAFNKSIFKDTAIIYIGFFSNYPNDDRTEYVVKYDSNFSFHYAHGDTCREFKNWQDTTACRYKSIRVYCYGRHTTISDAIKLVYYGLKHPDSITIMNDIPETHPYIPIQLYEIAKSNKTKEILHANYPEINAVIDQRYENLFWQDGIYSSLNCYYKDNNFYISHESYSSEFSFTNIHSTIIDRKGNYMVFTLDSVFYYVSFKDNIIKGPFILPFRTFTTFYDSFYVKNDSLIYKSSDGIGDVVCNMNNLETVIDTNTIYLNYKEYFFRELHAKKAKQEREKVLLARRGIMLWILLGVILINLALLRYKG